jgi:hypothetical protein
VRRRADALQHGTLCYVVLLALCCAVLFRADANGPPTHLVFVLLAAATRAQRHAAVWQVQQLAQVPPPLSRIARHAPMQALP